MGTIAGMLRKFQDVNTDQIIYQVVKGSEEDLLDLQREQMYDGKTNQGVDIRPSYLEDPYFEGDLQRAQAYSDWKDDITPNPRRNPGTPNLFINGFYYSSITVTVLPDTIVFKSRWAEGDDIERKFKNIYGLGGNIKVIYLRDYISPVLKQRIEDVTGLKYST